MTISERITKCQTLLTNFRGEVASIQEDFSNDDENSHLVVELLENLGAAYEDTENATKALKECDEAIVRFKKTLEQLSDKL